MLSQQNLRFSIIRFSVKGAVKIRGRDFSVVQYARC